MSWVSSKKLSVAALLLGALLIPEAAASLLPTERAALISFYNATGGPGWINKTNWLGPEGTECNWFGVRCDYTGTKVHALELDKNGLTGTLSSAVTALSGLSALTRLELRSNELRGTIPEEIVSISTLDYLDVSENVLSGAIPLQIGKLAQLRLLWLSNNDLSGPIPTSLTWLSKLQNLDLGYNHLEGRIPNSIGSLSMLRYLKLNANQLHGEVPSSITALSALCCFDSLDLTFNALHADPSTDLWLQSREYAWPFGQLRPPVGLEASTSTPSTYVALWWDPPAPDTLSGTWYELYADTGRGPVMVQRTANIHDTLILLTDLTPSTTYTFTVRNVRAADSLNPGNELRSDPTPPVTVRTAPPFPSVSIGDARVDERDGGEVSIAYFDITCLDKPADRSISVSYETVDGTAIAGQDFRRVPPTRLEFPPGVNVQTVQVVVVGDDVNEGSEFFHVKLSAALGARIVDGEGTATIVDSDGLRASDASVIEGSSGTTLARVVVSLPGPAQTHVSARWSTANGSAVAPRDFAASAGTIDIEVGQTSSTIEIPVVADSDPESDEFFWLMLSQAMGAPIEDGSAEVTILDDDGAQPVRPDPVIKVTGCSMVGESCTLEVGSASSADVSGWIVKWLVDDVERSQLRKWSPSFDLAGTYTVSLRASNAGGNAEARSTLRVEPLPTPCPPDRLCLLDDRFEVMLAATDVRSGGSGIGLPLTQSEQSGYFSIPALTSDAANPEVFVKLLDGRLLNGHFWFFFAGLTDFEYTLTVNDTEEGTSKIYTKPGGLSNGGFDVGSGVAEETCRGEVDGTRLRAPSTAPCQRSDDSLCLDGAHFAVSLTARDPRTGATGSGLAIPESDVFGYFSIPSLTNDPGNPEVFVKMLDGRAVNGFWWVFYSGLTDFEYTMIVTDTITGEVRSYTKAAGSACGAFDVDAF